MACGADGVELDVGVTPDGRLLVTHDLPPRSDVPLPTLDQVLALTAPGNFWFDIEAKSAPHLAPDPPRYAQLLSDALRRSPHGHRLIVRSFEHDILRAFHAIEPEIPLAALIAFPTGDWVKIARAASASIISPRYATVTRNRVSRAHDAGICVSVWTVNQPKDWDRQVEMGVDTIITDDPAAAVSYLASREYR